jgi:hypothetical protein
MRLSNPDLERQVVDAELATKKVEAQLGEVSLEGSKTKEALREGDRVIVSDMSTWKRYDHVQVR